MRRMYNKFGIAGLIIMLMLSIVGCGAQENPHGGSCGWASDTTDGVAVTREFLRAVKERDPDAICAVSIGIERDQIPQRLPDIYNALAESSKGTWEYNEEFKQVMSSIFVSILDYDNMPVIAVVLRDYTMDETTGQWPIPNTPHRYFISWREGSDGLTPLNSPDIYE